MNLLFTGGGGAATQAIYRLLGERHNVYFVDADHAAKPYWLHLYRWSEIPRANAPGFTSALGALCRQLEIDLLIPGVDEELLRIAMARNWGAFGCDVLLPDAEFIATHLDKLRSMQVLGKAGVPVPLTNRLQWWDGGYPCIIKPREGRGSRHVYTVESPRREDACVDFSELGERAFIAQELLRGQEYTVTMVADKHSRLRAVVPVKVGLKKGITIMAETDNDQNVTHACRRIHEAMPTPGVYNIQGIRAADGTFKPFEINPRVSTTTCLAMAAGVDVLGLYLDGGPVTELATFHGMTLRRSWHTEFAPASRQRVWRDSTEPSCAS